MNKATTTKKSEKNSYCYKNGFTHCNDHETLYSVLLLLFFLTQDRQY